MRPFHTLGQYDVVFDGAAMATLVDQTLGAALAYDKVVGDEGDMSYLAPPRQILGTRHAPPAVTILADRTLPRGMVFVESILFALNNVEQLGVPIRIFHPLPGGSTFYQYCNPQPLIVPPMKIRDFSFTALSDAV